MKAVVLAAGKGIRLRPLTNDRPKAMVELAKKPLLQHVLERLEDAKVTEVALIVGYKGEKIREYFGESFNKMKIVYITQEKQLGTAHAVGLAREFVGLENFLCTYTDVIVESEIYKTLVEKFTPKKQDMFMESVEKLGAFDAAIVGREVKDPWRFGVLEVEGERVLDIVEKPMIGQEPSKIINTGIYWLTPKIFQEIERTEKSTREEYEITNSLKLIAKQQRLGFVKYEGEWIDISNVKELKEAEKLLKSK